MDESLLVKRLKQFVHDNFEGNIQAFSTAIGQPPTTVRSCFNRNRKINVNILISLKKAFPEFDMNGFFSLDNNTTSNLLLHEEEDEYNKRHSTSALPTADGFDKLISFLKSNNIKIEIKSDT